MSKDDTAIALTCACPVCAQQPGQPCIKQLLDDEPDELGSCSFASEPHAERFALACSLATKNVDTPAKTEFERAIKESGLV